MLDAFIIEELRRREERENSRAEQPRLELPIDHGHERLPRRPRQDGEDVPASDRGVIILDF